MKRNTIKKWSITIFLTLVVLTIASCLGIKSQIRHHSGLNTEVVAKFKTLYG